MPDIWEDLATLSELAAGRDSARLLAFGQERCQNLAGKALATSLAMLDASAYIEGLQAAAQVAATKARTVMAPAVYFEYDMDNGWASNFFICSGYSSSDSDWASDWQDHVQGPSMPSFAREYASGFAADAISQGRTVMLIARTLAALLEATKSWPGDLVLGAAYHDQAEVSTLRRPA